jgi:ABC-type uncharacterized transport system ATPase subunit
MFTEKLASLPWIASLTRDGATLRILVHDLPRAKQELLPLIVAHSLILNRYEWVRPSLEEIFLQIST